MWRLFRVPSNFFEKASPSAQPFSGTWQDSHDMSFAFDSRLSKKSCSPSLILPGVIGLSDGVGTSMSWRPLGGVNAEAGRASAAIRAAASGGGVRPHMIRAGSPL